MPASPSLSVDFIGDGVFHVFQVEDVLFKLPAQQFSHHAQFFETLLSLPDKNPSTDDNPIQIYDTSIDTFVTVLEWLYRLPLSLTLDKEAWIKIFRFAQAYQMDLLQKEALDKMNTFDWAPVEQISFCERYSVDLSWAASSLATFASRWAPLTVEEEKSIESHTFGLIMKLREVAREEGWSHDRQELQKSNEPRGSWGWGTWSGIIPGLSWPPVVNFTATDVLNHLEKSGGGRTLTLRSRASMEHETAFSSPPCSEDLVVDCLEKRAPRRHERFYFSEESLRLSNEEMNLQFHTAVATLHAPSLFTRSINSASIDELFLSPTAVRCLRWMYREAEISDSSMEEWINILQFSHRVSFSHLKEAAISALAEPVSLGAIQRIRLCEECNLPFTWAEEAIKSISTREQALDLSGLEGLSSKTLLYLMSFRERCVAERLDRVQTELENEKSKTKKLGEAVEKEKAKTGALIKDLNRQTTEMAEKEARIKELEDEKEEVTFQTSTPKSYRGTPRGFRGRGQVYRGMPS